MKCVEAEPIPALEPLPARVIGIAASAGGVEPLRRLVADLPAGLDTAVCVVLHIPPTGRSLLAPILARHSAMTTVVAEHGMRLRAGTVYVAPADQHLLVRADDVELSHGPKENGVRPAADPMFRSLARAWGTARHRRRALRGARRRRRRGGHGRRGRRRVVVQEPSDAIVAGMPSSTLAVTTPDAVVPIARMAEALERLSAITCPRARSRRGGAPAGPTRWPVRFHVPGMQRRVVGDPRGEMIRYRCRVGHAYSEDAMVEAQGSAVESALWAALEILEERGELLRRIAVRMDSSRAGSASVTAHTSLTSALPSSGAC